MEKIAEHEVEEEEQGKGEEEGGKGEGEERREKESEREKKEEEGGKESKKKRALLIENGLTSRDGNEVRRERFLYSFSLGLYFLSSF